MGEAELIDKLTELKSGQREEAIDYLIDFISSNDITNELERINE